MAATMLKRFSNSFYSQFLLIFLASVTIRVAVSQWGHSGEGKPPMFGDFEAQRHWMEVTVNLPAEEWYVSTSDNDLQYWGLDYPPLTAYHMKLNGKIAQFVNESFVELKTSRGLETPQLKFFMRLSVIAMDILVFLPAAALYFMSQKRGKDSESDVLQSIMVLYGYPGLLLVDSGHFQYNNVSLGLMILATCALTQGLDLVGAVVFCLALNYKQMELYHALPFFAYLFGACISQPRTSNGLYKFSTLALVVVISFLVIWSPFLHTAESALAVVHRLFPVNRGLYEDKVANFWCASSVLVKFKSIFSQSEMAVICLLTTAIFASASFFHLLKHPTMKNFQYALVNSSLVFFLFSFHVHEKSILLAAIPVCLLIQKDTFAVMWFLIVSVFSMIPLLMKDGLLIPTAATTLLFWMIVNYYLSPTKNIRKDLKVMFQVSMLGATGLTLAFVVIKPPARYPDLFTLLIAVYSCAHFLMFAVYFHARQFDSLSDKALFHIEPHKKEEGKSSEDISHQADSLAEKFPPRQLRKRK